MMVRLAGVEPATLGLEVLGNGQPHTATSSNSVELQAVGSRGGCARLGVIRTRCRTNPAQAADGSPEGAKATGEVSVRMLPEGWLARFLQLRIQRIPARFALSGLYEVVVDQRLDAHQDQEAA